MSTTAIPHLEPNGANWAIFIIRFRSEMKATRRWAYFTGQKPCPEAADADKPTHVEQDAIDAWEYEDSVATHVLYQRLPDTIILRISGCSTTQERWEKVSQEYQAKSAYAQADLHRSFREMRCAKGEQVRDFLARLCCKRAELDAAGVPITEKEYERTILQGIPSELATFASHIVSSVLVVHGAASIELDTLVKSICEEADRLKSRRAHGARPGREGDHHGSGLCSNRTRRKEATQGQGPRVRQRGPLGPQMLHPNGGE